MIARVASLTSIVALAILTGCAPKGAYEKAEVASRSLATTRAELTGAKAQIDLAVAALDDLVNNPQADMKKQYATFSSAVDSLNKSVDKARDRALDARAKREEYLAQWKADTEAISNPDLKARALQRMGDAKASFERLREHLDAIRTTAAPFHSDINDLRRYLGNDLTPAGVKSVSDLVTKTRSGATDTKTKIDEAIAEIDRVSAEISPSAAPAS